MADPGASHPIRPVLRLAQGTHDRAAHLRVDEGAIEKAWADPRARVLRVHDSRCALLTDGDDLAYLTASQVQLGAPRYFLGFDPDGVPHFAVDAGFEPGPGERVAHLREVSSRLSGAAAGLFVHAVGLANWHARNRYCPVCGGETVAVAAGHVRRCTRCGAEQFPRSDPAVIMLVTDDDDRALLGRAPAWPEGRFSTLAGFVEPGESLEQAVIREVHEEVGVVVTDVTYEGSQPWPLPGSLMVGFRARARTAELRVDPAEIAEARWLSREDLIEAGRRREILMPGAISIARWLIERWFGGPLPRENAWGATAR